MENMTNEQTNQIAAYLPRSLSFGKDEVRENLSQEYLSNEQREIYGSGFVTLKRLTTTTPLSQQERIILTNPAVVSGLIGIQPLLSISETETVTVLQAFAREGISFRRDFALFQKQFTPGFYLVNINAALNVLETYQSVLGVSLPNGQDAEQAAATIAALMSNYDLAKMNLLFGLLSGFPLEDCLSFVKNLKVSDRASTSPMSVCSETTLNVLVSTDASTLPTPRYVLQPNLLEDQYFPQILPDDNSQVTIAVLGLFWRSSLPLTRSTIQKIQELYQVDREFRLQELMIQSRSDI